MAVVAALPQVTFATDLRLPARSCRGHFTHPADAMRCSAAEPADSSFGGAVSVTAPL